MNVEKAARIARARAALEEAVTDMIAAGAARREVIRAFNGVFVQAPASPEHLAAARELGLPTSDPDADKPYSDEQVEALLNCRSIRLVAGEGCVRRLWLAFETKNEDLVVALVRLHNAEERIAEMERRS